MSLRQFMKVAGARLYIDGVLVRTIPEYIGFDRLYFVLSGPRQNGVVYFDQFSINANPINAPVANAGSNQTVHAGAIVTLDGSGSNDPGGNLPLAYEWKFTAKPAGSTAALDDPTSKTPSFNPDMYNAGNWVLELVVTNSLGGQERPRHRHHQHQQFGPGGRGRARPGHQSHWLHREPGWHPELRH